MVHFMFIASMNSYATNAFVDDEYMTNILLYLVQWTRVVF